MKSTHRRYRVWLTLPALLVLVWVGAAHAQSVTVHPLIDSPAEAHPAYGQVPSIETFSDELLPLWLSAMQRNDPELCRLAAAAITEAQQKGVVDLAPDAGQPLRELLNREDQPLAVYTAAAEALIALDITDAAPAILAMNEKYGGAFAQLTDPALVQWNHEPAQKLWNQRIADPLTPNMLRASAIESAAAVGDASSAAVLQQLASSGTGGSLRLVAARALGKVVTSGLESMASNLAGSTDTLDRIVAAEILAGHKSDGAKRQLAQLVADDSPTVAGAAVRSLIAIDITALADVAETLAARDDANLRAFAVTILEARADGKAVATLTQLLGDVNPAVRNSARESLLWMAQHSLGDAVRSAAAEALQSKRWQAREQAALIVGKLDDEQAGDALVGLLTDDRFEVRVAAIAALRWLAVDAHNAAILARLETAMRDTTQETRQQRYVEIGQLVQYLGVMRYAEADAALQKFIPKKAAFGGKGRVGAIWSLGMIHEGQEDARLAGQFASRLRDWQGMEPEGNDVRAMSAIAIGMLKAKSQLGVLEAFFDGESQEPDISRACRWSILQIQPDRELPEEEIPSNSSGNWFLTPLPQR